MAKQEGNNEQQGFWQGSPFDYSFFMPLYSRQAKKMLTT